MKNVNKQKGFTIIELVVVILLLGILTATALPRFMDVTDEAHDAVVQGVLTGLNTSSGLFRAQWYAEGQPNTVSDYALHAPGGYAFGSLDSTVTSTECVSIYESFLQSAGRPLITTIEGASAIEIDNLSITTFAFMAKAGDDGDGICRYAYTGQFVDAVTGTNPIIEYDVASGEFTLDAVQL